MPEPPSLNGGLIGVASVSEKVGIQLAGAVTIVGEPGATEPGTTIRITNLDNTDVDPIEVQADSAGGFMVDLEVPLGNELRFQPLRGGVRGEPVDAVSVGQALEAASRHDCLRATTLHLDFPGVGADTAEVGLENTCASPATVESTGTRLGLTEFALGTELPIVIAPGESAKVLVDRDPTVEAEREDVLFLRVGIDGEGRRLPITLYTPSR